MPPAAEPAAEPAASGSTTTGETAPPLFSRPLSPSAREGHAAALLLLPGGSGDEGRATSASADVAAAGALYIFGGQAVSAGEGRVGEQAQARLADAEALQTSSELWRMDLSTRQWALLTSAAAGPHSRPSASGVGGGVGSAGGGDGGAAAGGAVSAVGIPAGGSVDVGSADEIGVEDVWPRARSGHSLTQVSLPGSSGQGALLLFGGAHSRTLDATSGFASATSSEQQALLDDLWIFNASAVEPPTAAASTPSSAPSTSAPPSAPSAAWQRVFLGFPSGYSPAYQPGFQASPRRSAYPRAFAQGYPGYALDADVEYLESSRQAAGAYGFGGYSAGYSGAYSGAYGGSYSGGFDGGFRGSYGPSARMAHAAVVVPLRGAQSGASAALLILGGVGYAASAAVLSDHSERRRTSPEGGAAQAPTSAPEERVNVYASSGLPASFQVRALPLTPPLILTLPVASA